MSDGIFSPWYDSHATQTHGIVGDYKYLPPRTLKLDKRQLSSTFGTIEGRNPKEKYGIWNILNPHKQKRISGEIWVMLEVSNRKLHDITKQDSYVCLSNAPVHRKLQAEPAQLANTVAMLFLMVLDCWLFLQTWFKFLMFLLIFWPWRCRMSHEAMSHEAGYHLVPAVTWW